MDLTENKKIEYSKNEYCKATNCAGLNPKGKCVFDESGCVRTAKQFHKWLNENGFIIVKK